MLILSSPVIELVSQSGWSPDRRVDIAHVISAIDLAGFALNAFAVEFLESFYGIRVDPPRNPNAAYRPEPVVFDPLYDKEFDRIRAWLLELGNITPIGKGFGHRSSLVMSDKGEMFGISDIGVHLIGTDITAAMDTLLLGIVKPKLVYDVQGK